jgi:Mg-chelatase subunit ChlD
VLKKKNRHFEIISLSALDLFAATLGAFIIVVTILIPYYPNMYDAGSTRDRMKEEIEENQRRLVVAEQKIATLERERQQRLEEQASASLTQSQKAELTRRIAQVRAQNSQEEKEVGSLREQLADLKSKIEAKKKAGNQGDTDFAILGITTKAKSIVVVVDLSGSMQEWSSTLVSTVLEIIEPFNKDVRFAILGFQNDDVSVFWPQVALRMAIADDKTKLEAQKLIRAFPGMLSGGTPTRNALRLALNYNPDAIILVSDGQPDEHPDSVVEAITALNTKKIEINTVAVGDYLKNSVLIKFLNDLAKRNRGQFVGVMP